MKDHLNVIFNILLYLIWLMTTRAECIYTMKPFLFTRSSNLHWSTFFFKQMKCIINALSCPDEIFKHVEREYCKIHDMSFSITSIIQYRKHHLEENLLKGEQCLINNLKRKNYFISTSRYMLLLFFFRLPIYFSFSNHFCWHLVVFFFSAL